MNEISKWIMCSLNGYWRLYDLNCSVDVQKFCIFWRLYELNPLVDNAQVQ